MDFSIYTPAKSELLTYPCKICLLIYILEKLGFFHIYTLYLWYFCVCVPSNHLQNSSMVPGRFNRAHNVYKFKGDCSGELFPYSHWWRKLLSILLLSSSALIVMDAKWLGVARWPNGRDSKWWSSLKDKLKDCSSFWGSGKKC